MSLSIVVAVTASCAAYMTISGKRGPQKGMAGLSADQIRLESQTPHLINKVPSYAHAGISSRTQVDISLWSSVP
jgi:hypothetical protein